MKAKLFTIVSALLLLLAVSAFGQRSDAIWARSTAGATITLDGVMNEAVWAKAESLNVSYGKNAGLPGSGWRQEAGVAPTDSTNATLKFLVAGNKFYLGVFCRDLSVGGGEFNRFDGLLMNLRARSNPNRPAPPFEYFYAWWTAPDTTLDEIGKLPGFFGFAGGRRDSVVANGLRLGDIWNAVTTVLGVSNDDATPDVGWVTEVEFNLDALSFTLPNGTVRNSGGYDVTRPEGDIIEFNISIYDADWQWPVDPARFSGNRAWLQGPWGNANSFNVLRIYANPNITVNSGAVPAIGPDLTVKNLATSAAPVIDGNLNDQIWEGATKFDLRYGDDALRLTYPTIGPYRSGQFQPAINGVRASVVNPADATISYFYKGNTFYVGIDVRDEVVTAVPRFDQFDGVNLTITDVGATDPAEFRLLTRELIARVDTNGVLTRSGYLPFLIDSLSGAQVGLYLKPGTTINDPNDSDVGYSIEIAVDLTKVGYVSAGGQVLWWGITLLDGDSFVQTADDYGNRVWFFRENGGSAAPAWSYLDPTPTSVAGRGADVLPNTFALLGNYPNPFNPSTSIRFTMPAAGVVTLKVFDVLGRNVATVPLGLQEAGAQEISFDAAKLSSGVYLYRLEMTTRGNRQSVSTGYGKMTLMK